MTSTSFAEAQERLAARRRARAETLRPPESSASSSRPSTTGVWHTLTSLTSPISSALNAHHPPFRVSQLDASLLDDELLELLYNQAADGLKYYSGGHLHSNWTSEIHLALRAVLFKLTVWDHNATYGAALQNLRFSDARRDGSSILVQPSRWQKGMHGLVTVAGRYAWERWEDWLRSRNDGYVPLEDSEAGRRSAERVRTLSRMTEAARTLHAAAAVVSFLGFLLWGKYRTLLDRVLRMRLAPPTSQVSREVSFEYQNRQLVWHAFTEFLLFILPLLGITRWRRWLSRIWHRTKSVLTRGTVPSDDAPRGEYSFLPERTCAICYHEQNSKATSETDMLATAAAAGGVVGSAATDITNPYETMPCGCIYCFVCIANCLEEEEGEGWTCLRCGGLVKECRPWGGDVLDKKGRRISASGKTVAFSDELDGEEEDSNEGGIGGSLQVIDSVPLDDGVMA